jgi:hypothetical protein
VEKRTDIWQVEGSFVFKLQESGIVRRDGPQLVNEYAFSVQHWSPKHTRYESAVKQEQMALHIAVVLNTPQVPQNVFFGAEQLLEEIKLANLARIVNDVANSRIAFERIGAVALKLQNATQEYRRLQGMLPNNEGLLNETGTINPK